MPVSNQKKLQQTARILTQKAAIRSKRNERVLFLNAAVLSVFGYLVATPVFIGLLVGYFLDKKFPVDHVSWRFNFAMLGFVAGLFCAYKWVKREGVIKNKRGR